MPAPNPDSDPQPDTLPPLEQAMQVYVEGLRQQHAAEAGRAGMYGVYADEQRRRAERTKQLQALQAERNRRGEGTPCGEALGALEADQCRQFLEILDKVKDQNGTDGFAPATVLPLGGERSTQTIRGFFVGCTGRPDSAPMDTGWTRGASGLFLCEDGTLRTYHPDRPEPAQGVPLLPDGEHETVYPGYFAQQTVGVRRLAEKPKIPKPGEPIKPLPIPRGVESIGERYRLGDKYYRSHEVHPFRPETLQDTLAATLHYVLEERRARPTYDYFNPAAAHPQRNP
jgi:hypothetical protein